MLFSLVSLNSAFQAANRIEITFFKANYQLRIKIYLAIYLMFIYQKHVDY